MSNPTELPDFEPSRLANLVRAAGYEMAASEYQHAWNLAKGGPGLEDRISKSEKEFLAAVEKITARRAQPEGEAPQAELVAEFADDFIFNLRKQPNGERWPVGTKLYVHPPAAKHAESGAQAEELRAALLELTSTQRKLIDANAELAMYQLAAQSQGAQPLPTAGAGDPDLDAARWAEVFYRNAETFTVRDLGIVRAAWKEAIRRAALAAKAEAPAAQQAAAPGALPDQAQFEAQARYQGATNFEPVHPDFMVCNNGWTPATYRDPMTELAWRVWANKRIAPSAPGTPEAPASKHLPGWERGIATVTLNGHQLREALDFINPDGDDDEDQRDNELTFGIVQHKDDDGNAATGLCCWNDDSDGVLPLDSEPRAAQLDGGQGEGLKRCAAGRDGECRHKGCPQLRDNEPAKSGRHCPLDEEGSESNG